MSDTRVSVRCVRCVLSDDIPGIAIDASGVCSQCRQFDHHRAAYDAYFRTEDELITLMRRRAADAREFDVLLLYSGGKDSTYVLYRLVDLGFRVLALTFDNGFIPRGCFDNIRGVCDDLGVPSEIARVAKDNMNAAFAAGLKESASVCGSCYRGLTARGTETAMQRGIPIMMTGLSRGQICATKLFPLIATGTTAPDAIERHLLMMREVYHARRDKVGALVDDRVLADRSAFGRIDFIDFFRYSAVTKAEIVDLIATRAPFWRKPGNVGGCSSNCAINDVGIHVYRQQRGFHPYAIPTSWEVRLGHTAREDAIAELDEEIDANRVHSIMRAIGYAPTP